MHTIDGENFEKVIRSVSAGPADIAYQHSVELGFKWLNEYESRLLLLTDEQATVLKHLLSF